MNYDLLLLLFRLVPKIYQHNITRPKFKNKIKPQKGFNLFYNENKTIRYAIRFSWKCGIITEIVYYE